ncbi:MAG: precorrin-2/cobalt-factor-2 C20-methyltransferase, partial [Methylobacteriaceae bacterium]|nr:precorrin-2/cobalt-factor-2 C20-methyltransferase [Methylobacteriaceae bacterium]
MNIRDPQSILDASAPVVAGTLHGIGVGPGDPELMTIRAVRLIREARVIAYFA